MGKIIELEGRYSTHTLKKLSPTDGRESSTYKFILGSEGDIIRAGYLEDQTFFIDPSGGPFIKEGDVIEDKTIKHIDYSPEISSYIITFK